MIELTIEELKKRLESSERRRSSLQRALRHNSPEEDNLFWSIADLMTLLLVFFVLFYSHAIRSKPESPQGAAISQTIVAREQKEAMPKPEQPTAAALIIQEEQFENVVSEAKTKDAQPMKDIRQQALQLIDDSDAENISVRWTNNQLVFVLAEQITFNAGQAELVDAFQPTLLRIAAFIADKDGYRIAVSGHTDDTPIHTPMFPSNWELSAARAVTVARFLITHGVPADRISIQGYAEYKPLYQNTTSENRQSNRRVEITLIREQKQESTTNRETDGSDFRM